MAYRTPYRQLAFVPLLLLAVMLYLVTVDAVKRWFYRRFSPRRPTPMMNTRFLRPRNWRLPVRGFTRQGRRSVGLRGQEPSPRGSCTLPGANDGH